jgi:hypothetical protein
MEVSSIVTERKIPKRMNIQLLANKIKVIKDNLVF